MPWVHSHLDASLFWSEPQLWLVVSVIVFVASYVRATIGFGSGLIIVGLMTLMFPIKIIVPLALMLELLGSVLLGGYDFRHIRWKELGWILTGSLLGIVIGVWLLDATPAQHLTLFFGIFLLLYVLYAVWVKPQRLPDVKRSWGLPLGFFSGVIGSLFGGGGPPLVAYLQMRKLDKRAFRATLQGIGLIDSIGRIGLYLLYGLLTVSQAEVFLMLAPVVIAGLWFGNRLHFRISEHAFLNGTLVLLSLIAGKYLLSAVV